MIAWLILKLPHFCAEYRLMYRAMLFLQASLRYTFVVTISIIRSGAIWTGFIYFPKVPWNVMVPDSWRFSLWMVQFPPSRKFQTVHSFFLKFDGRRASTYSLLIDIICAFPIPIATPVFSKSEYGIHSVWDMFFFPRNFDGDFKSSSRSSRKIHAKQIGIICLRVMAF